jgi:non-ribosomal peptide synthetase component E (peptide arylation enzyme)
MFRHAQSDGAKLALCVDDRNVSYSELAVLAQRTAAWLTRDAARPVRTGNIVDSLNREHR